MNSTGIKVRELTEIATLLERNKCAHYKYDDVLEHLNVILALLPIIISFQEELALKKLEESLLQVFSVENFEVVQCSGCNYASLIREVLKRSQSIGLISALCKTLNSGELES